MNENFSPEHDARTCRACRRMMHPSQLQTRRALAALPRQKTLAGQDRDHGGAR